MSINKIMERRFSRRVPVRLEAFIVTGGKTYNGFIENVSEDGFECLITSTFEVAKDFHLGNVIELYFQLPSGNSVNLSCEIKWVLKTYADEKVVTLGVKVKDPPEKIKDFVKTLEIVSVN